MNANAKLLSMIDQYRDQLRTKDADITLLKTSIAELERQKYEAYKKISELTSNKST
jgi:phage shock protein A